MNYQIELEKILEREKDNTPTLLLQACCAPCSSYVLEYLASHFHITIIYYNPNITLADEFEKRFNEVVRLVSEMNLKNKVEVIKGEYDPKVFLEMARGKESLPERSERCYSCYSLRMDYTAHLAKTLGYDYFGTTLSISPYKNSDWINEIGGRLEEAYGVKYLYADFKKKNGYKRSIELSAKYGLYRQNYCGCSFSKRDREKCLPDLKEIKNEREA